MAGMTIVRGGMTRKMRRSGKVGKDAMMQVLGKPSQRMLVIPSIMGSHQRILNSRVT